jgi:hypothetical protein
MRASSSRAHHETWRKRDFSRLLSRSADKPERAHGQAAVGLARKAGCTARALAKT